MRGRWLDQWLRAKGNGLRDLIEAVGEAVERYEAQQVREHNERQEAELVEHQCSTPPKRRRRSRKAADLERLKQAIALICCNLAYAALSFGTERPVAYSRRKSVTPTRYDNPLVFTDIFRTAIDRMGAVGLLEDVRGARGALSSTMRPTDGFLSELEAYGVSKGDLEHCRGAETIILSSKHEEDAEAWGSHHKPKGVWIPYEDTEETARLRAQLDAINAHLVSADIAFLDDGSQPSVDTFRRTLRRYFSVVGEEGTPRFDKGGRLFGGWWQGLKSNRRTNIRIDGQPCAYLDYSSMFPRLAYARAGLTAPSGDLYDLEEHWPAFRLSDHRRGAKVAFNSLFFGRKRLDAETKEGLPSDATLPRFQEAVGAKHPALQDVLGSQIGFDLMMDESSIMVGVLTELMEKNITGLPIHDGLLVPQSVALEASRIMKRVALEHAHAVIEVQTTYLGSSPAKDVKAA